MSYDIGPRIGIEGEAQYRKSMRDINASLKAMAAEMKAVTAAYDAGDKSEEKLRKQQELLNRQMAMQLKKLLGLKEGLEQAKAKYGETDEVTQKWECALQEARAELSRLEGALANNTNALNEAEAANSAAARAQQQAEEAARRLREEQARLARQVGETSERLQASSEAMGSINRAALVAASAMAGVTLAAGKVGMDFEAQMSKVGAISNASTEDMEVLSQAAKEMGATTKFSATESAQALEYMAMAGWKSQQMADGLPGIINLAAASGEDLASVSDIVTDALTAFGLQASDSAHFADVLAKASSSSNTNVALLGETFKYAAPVAGALGYSVEDVAVAVGMMANAGIKGEQAGTALRGVLTNLAKPTRMNKKYLDELGISLTETDGAIKPLNQVIAELREKFSALTDAQKAEYAAGIAGKEAMSGLLAVVNGSDTDFENLTLAIASSNGTAKKMADTMSRNLKGQLTALGSAAESVGIAFYEKFQKQAAGAVSNLANGLRNFGNQLASGKLDQALDMIASGAIAAGAGLVTLNAALMVRDISNFATAAKAGAAAMSNYRSATIAGTIAQKAFNLAQSLTPWGLAAVAVGTAVTALVAYNAITHEATSASEKLNERTEETAVRFQELSDSQQGLAKARGESVASINAEFGMVENYVSELQSLVDANGKVKDGYEMRAQFLADQINNLIPNAVEVNKEEEESIYKVNDALEEQIFARKKAMVIDAMEEEYTEAYTKMAEATQIVTDRKRELGVAEDLLADAMKREEQAADPQSKARAREEVRKLTGTVDECRQSLTEAEGVVSSYQNTLDTVDSLHAATAMDELDSAAIRSSNALVQSTGNNQEALAKAVADAQLNYSRILSEASHAWRAMSADQQAQWGSMGEYMEQAWGHQINTAKTALDQQVRIAADGGVNITTALGDGVSSGAYIYPEEIQAMLDAGFSEMRGATGKFFGYAESYGIETAAGIKSTEGEPKSAFEHTLELMRATGQEKVSWFDKVGYNLALGVAQGIRNGKKPIMTAMSDGILGALSAAKNTGIIQSPSHLMRDEVGIMLSRGVAVGVQKGLPYIQEAAREMIGVMTDNIDNLNAKIAQMEEKARKRQDDKELAAYRKSIEDKNDEIKKLETIEKQKLQDEIAELEKKGQEKLSEESRKSNEKAIKKKYEELEELETTKKQKILDDIAKLQADWDEKQNKEAEDAEKAILQKRIASLQKQQKELEDFKKEYEAGLQEIEGKQQSMADKIAGYGNLFETVKKGTKDILQLGDLQKDIDKITAYGDALEWLKAQNVSDSLMNEVTNRSIDDALHYTDMLMEKTPEQFDKYMGLWEEKQAAAAEVARNFYQGEFDNLKREYVDKIPNQLSGLKDSMSELGVHAAQELAKGFRSQREHVTSAFTSVLSSALRATQKEQGVHSPSTVWAELGANLAAGLGVGFADKMRDVSRQIQDSIPPAATETAPITRIGEGVVNGMMAAVQSGGATTNQPIHVVLNVSGKVLAEAVIDPLKGVAKQRGVPLG